MSMNHTFYGLGYIVHLEQTYFRNGKTLPELTPEVQAAIGGTPTTFSSSTSAGLPLNFGAVVLGLALEHFALTT
jgi:hypothetical protein